MMIERLFSRVLVATITAGLLTAPVVGQSDRIVDLAMASPEDGLLRRVHGAMGRGNFGLPVAGGHDVDGDGHVDYAVAFFLAASSTDASGLTSAGEVDLIFGDGTTGGVVDTAVDDPAVLRFVGSQMLELAGSEIWMDDVTGDGLGDLLICRQNFSPDPARIGAGALTLVVGSPALRAQAASFERVNLGAPPAEVVTTTLVGAAELDRLGIWARTGDVDGDGIADLVVGADQEDSGGEINRGAVYVVRGGPHLAAGGVFDLAASQTGSALAGHLAKITPPTGSGGNHFGATNQIADLDGNGRAEVMAAATLNRAGAGIEAAGAPPGSAVPVGGAPDGVLYIAWDDNFPTETWPDDYAFDIFDAPGTRTSIRGESANVSFGEEILGGMDVDGDGAADLFAGDLVADGTQGGTRPLSGLGHLLYGAAALKGLDIDLDVPPPGLRVTRILGPSAGAIGADTAAHGDFDGDGATDLAFTSPHAAPQGRNNAGMVHVLFGRPGGWPASIDLAAGALPPASEIRIAEIHGARGNQSGDVGDTLGYSAAAGDVDADGRSDLIVNEMVGNGLAPDAVDVGNLLVVSGRALSPGIATCVASSTALCLADSRFLVEASWRTSAGETGEGQAVQLTADTGTFWFFSADNVEMVVKVLDACELPGFENFWVFAGGLTDVEVTLRITDTLTSEVQEYFNPQGTPFQPIQDTAAFDTCTELDPG